MAEKRKIPPHAGPSAAPKKQKRQWSKPHQPPTAAIHTGDVGIFATCDKGREGQCVRELNNLFQEYAEKLYGDDVTSGDSNSRQGGRLADEEALDIEAEIQDEVQSLKSSRGISLFTNVKIDVQCVCFFRTLAPVEPVAFVHAICADAQATGRKKTRFTKRLTPVSASGKATEDGVDALAKSVLAPHFHTADGPARTYAIRPTLRHHGEKILTRDSIIEQVAKLVGTKHKVNLTQPEHTILVEVYKHTVGMSVVGDDFDALKRFNLAEIYQPSDSGKDGAAGSKSSAKTAALAAEAGEQGTTAV